MPFFVNFTDICTIPLRMRALIKQARVINPESPFHNQVKDIFINNGIIEKIDDEIAMREDTRVIEGNDLHISAGWVDIFADFAEPGYEHRETIETGVKAAVAGGFTDVFIIPNTKPAIDSKGSVEFIKSKSATLAATVHPLGCVTKSHEGKELAEMYDMFNAGTIAFSDGNSPVQNAAIMLKALQYVAAKQSVIIQLPDNTSISATGLVNEGIISTQMGLPGKPAIAEELMIARDIELLRYTKSALHITGVSTAKGLALINAAKSEGLNITCSVTPYHLLLCDEDLKNYDCNLKVKNPLRTKKDMEALRSAFHAGEIDCIATHHSPQHSDSKVCEFEYAHYGMIGLQTAYSLLCSIGIDTATIIGAFTNARKIFGLGQNKIFEGEKATLTIFSPSMEWEYSTENNFSKSLNTPFLGQKMKGKALAIYNKNTLHLND